MAKADGCLAPTPESAEIYRAVRRGEVAFIPTPYPTHDAQWNFASRQEERRGILVGTREWEVPSRNHAAALLAARGISERTGETVTVYDFGGRSGGRLLEELGFAEGSLTVMTKRSSYADYLRVVARHKIVFQLDTSFVPGQVAGDALLCRMPCVGGNGAVNSLAFPELCGTGRSLRDVIELAVGLTQDAIRYGKVVAASQERVTSLLSFRQVASQLEEFFKALQ